MHTRFVEAIWKKPYSEINEKKFEKFKKMGGSFSVENGIVQSASLASTNNDPKHLIKTIEDKIELINGGSYQKFERYGLYVFVDTVFIDEHFSSYVQQVIDEISLYQERFTMKYDTLYLDQLYTLCICDMVKKSFCYKEITREMRKRIHQAAENGF